MDKMDTEIIIATEPIGFPREATNTLQSKFKKDPTLVAESETSLTTSNPNAFLAVFSNSGNLIQVVDALTSFIASQMGYKNIFWMSNFLSTAVQIAKTKFLSKDEQEKLKSLAEELQSTFHEHLTDGNISVSQFKELLELLTAEEKLDGGIGREMLCKAEFPSQKDSWRFAETLISREGPSILGSSDEMKTISILLSLNVDELTPERTAQLISLLASLISEKLSGDKLSEFLINVDSTMKNWNRVGDINFQIEAEKNFLNLISKSVAIKIFNLSSPLPRFCINLLAETREVDIINKVKPYFLETLQESTDTAAVASVAHFFMTTEELKEAFKSPTTKVMMEVILMKTHPLSSSLYKNLSEALQRGTGLLEVSLEYSDVLENAFLGAYTMAKASDKLEMDYWKVLLHIVKTLAKEDGSNFDSEAARNKFTKNMGNLLNTQMYEFKKALDNSDREMNGFRPEFSYFIQTYVQLIRLGWEIQTKDVSNFWNMVTKTPMSDTESSARLDVLKASLEKRGNVLDHAKLWEIWEMFLEHVTLLPNNKIDTDDYEVVEAVIRFVPTLVPFDFWKRMLKEYKVPEKDWSAGPEDIAIEMYTRRMDAMFRGLAARVKGTNFPRDEFIDLVNQCGDIYEQHGVVVVLTAWVSNRENKDIEDVVDAVFSYEFCFFNFAGRVPQKYDLFYALLERHNEGNLKTGIWTKKCPDFIAVQSIGGGASGFEHILLGIILLKCYPIENTKEFGFPRGYLLQTTYNIKCFLVDDRDYFSKEVLQDLRSILDRFIAAYGKENLGLTQDEINEINACQ